MKKFKALIATLLVLSGTTLFAKDFDWSECWCNYGADIKEGDKLLSVDLGLGNYFFGNLTSPNWAIPASIVTFEVVQPIWKLPFTFGGYLGFDARGTTHHDYTNSYFNIYTGGVAAYHIMLPPENLDLYAATKAGFKISFYNSDVDSVRRDEPPVRFDFGEVIGASWYFDKDFGINLELGYPVSKFGVVFKF